MDWPLPAAMTLLGIASGVHCMGMCGGIVGAFSTHRVTLVRDSAPEWRRQIAFNLGRISSYGLAGALVGFLGGAGAYVAGALNAQIVLYVLANAMLVLMGLYLAGYGRWMRHIEALGAPLWRALQPLAARLLPARTLPGAYLAGTLWGWLPCGLVYGALATAAFAGAASQGAIAMLAFGLGTLPTMLAAGLLAARLRAWMARRVVRAGAGVAVLAFGAYGLMHAGGIAEGIRHGLLCL